MGSDSIDPELFRLPIPAPDTRLDPPLHLLLYALFKSIISEPLCGDRIAVGDIVVNLCQACAGFISPQNGQRVRDV
jgi:hypothetical protein